LSRGEAGHGDLGEDPVGDGDARVGGLQHRRLMQADPRVGEHLVGDLAARGRVGEAGEPVAAQAAGERQQRDGVRLTLRRTLARWAAARQHVPAGRRRRLERGRLRRARAERFLELAGRGRVGEVGHPVRAHADGEPGRVLLRLGICHVAAGAGRAGRAGRVRATGGEHNGGDDRGCGQWTMRGSSEHDAGGIRLRVTRVQHARVDGGCAEAGRRV
jgi:hypothetical protein